MPEIKQGKIVIVGAGEVGRSVAGTLSSEGWDICLVSQAQAVKSELDILVIAGNGAHPQVPAQTSINSGTVQSSMFMHTWGSKNV
ncbi:MAG: NAD-binding protein [Synergistaceae bacterium]|nr:NAD-binding protein [Synergistaceae bacterium]